VADLLPDTRRRLEGLVSRIEEVERYPFFKGGANIAGGSYKRSEDRTWTAEFHGPEPHETDAVLLLMRMLVQRDDFSIGRLEELCEDPGLSDSWKEEYRQRRERLNRRLDEIHATGAKGTLTYRQVMHMFLYGRRGHFKGTDEGYKLYDIWVTNDRERQLLQDTFFQVVIWVFTTAINIARASREELARHPRQVSSLKGK
jgi:hypothetical protein